MNEPAKQIPGDLSVGSLLAAISTRIVALLREHYGHGPMKAKTYALDDIIVVVMRGSGLPLWSRLMDRGVDGPLPGFGAVEITAAA